MFNIRLIELNSIFQVVCLLHYKQKCSFSRKREFLFVKIFILSAGKVRKSYFLPILSPKEFIF